MASRVKQRHRKKPFIAFMFNPGINMETKENSPLKYADSTYAEWVRLGCYLPSNDRMRSTQLFNYSKKKQNFTDNI